MSDIDPRDFGRLEAEVESLRNEVAGLRADVRELLAIVSQAKGGWRTLVMVGSVAGAIGAFLAKVVQWWPK